MKKLLKSLNACGAIIIMLLLSGCIKMDVSQTIEKNGYSHIEVTYDASEFAEYMEGFEESFDDESSETASFDESGMDASCDEFYTETQWSNPECSVEDWVFSMSGDIQLKSPAFTKSGSTYKYDLKNLYEVLAAVGESQDQEFSDQALLEQKDMVELTGIELTYTLEMPGTITVADIGTIQEDGKTLVIDLFDLAGVDTAYVEAKGSGSIPWAIIGIVAGILIVLGFIIMIIKRKKTAGTGTNQSQPNPPESEIKL